LLLRQIVFMNINNLFSRFILTTQILMVGKLCNGELGFSDLGIRQAVDHQRQQPYTR